MFEDLVKMAKAEDMGNHLSELIYQSLSTQGGESIDKEYPDGVHNLQDYGQLLDLLSKMHSAFKRSSVQPGAHIAKRWATHALLKRGADIPATLPLPPRQPSAQEPMLHHPFLPRPLRPRRTQ